MVFNEDSRVKIPTILHLVRLGYEYLSLKNQKWDESTNIFTDIFKESIHKINTDLSDTEVQNVFDEVSLALENDDLGRAFYEKLIDRSGIRLIDYDNFENNSFHVVTELTYKNGDDDFRPDITLLINGIPLIFIEVKKPNNQDGILAEHKRIKSRFKNSKFKKFVNITQLMVFSNNMEYDDDSSVALQGAYYATSSYDSPIFNYFREEEKFDLDSLLKPIDNDIEDFVLEDNNYQAIKNSPEFLTNKKPTTPTNRICTSLFQLDRLKFILQYAFAYVKSSGNISKQIMRYPQIFATKEIEKRLDEGGKKGIIWHTQGSGKTALAYYNVKFLTDYFQSKGIIPKFYFIVDRLDLLIQAGREFKSRGLSVHTVNSKEEFAKEIKENVAIHNDSGKTEITVVNIHKFEEDPNVVRNTDYDINIQRIYFLDEVHRSYSPKGSFLANLDESDRNAMKIGLTGTPLLGDYSSKVLFGTYIHKYYYNSSIADGYTLRLIREEIETTYKSRLEEALAEVKLLKGNAKREIVYAHHKFVEPMLDYIITDFTKSRIIYNDYSIGALVICDSSNQAREMFDQFNKKYPKNLDYINKKTGNDNVFDKLRNVAEPIISYNPDSGNEQLKAALILYDENNKDIRKDLIEEFKDGKIDFLFVYNMLLTGFDSPRLKKLYLGRIVKKHNLLQALTRVNRTYKKFKYGYVVDFANIQDEFDKTNRAYFEELQGELGDEMIHYSNLFKKPEEIEVEIQEIKEILFHFDTNNRENFSNQIEQISDRKEMLKITKALNTAQALYNLIRLSGQYDLLEKLDFRTLTDLAREANNHLRLINQKDALENDLDSTNLLNLALEEIIFTFTKVNEEELKLADELKNILQRTREMLAGNFDHKDPEFVSLKEELERLFKKKNLTEVTKDEMEDNIEHLTSIYNRAKELERQNQLLKAKYDNDAKYACLHKRLMEKDPLTEKESKLFEVLSSLKTEVDNLILQNSHMMENENFIEKLILRNVVEQFKNKHNLNVDTNTCKRINGLLVKEYMNEYYGVVA